MLARGAIIFEIVKLLICDNFIVNQLPITGEFHVGLD